MTALKKPLTGADAPEDVWLIVVQTLFRKGWWTSGFNSLVRLSSTCHRMRRLGLRYIFRSKTFSYARQLDALSELAEVNSKLPEYFRALTLRSSIFESQSPADSAMVHKRLDCALVLWNQPTVNSRTLISSFGFASRTLRQLETGTEGRFSAFFDLAKDLSFTISDEFPMADLLPYLEKATHIETFHTAVHGGFNFEPDENRLQVRLPSTIRVLSLSGMLYMFEPNLVASWITQLPALEELTVRGMAYRDDLQMNTFANVFCDCAPRLKKLDLRLAHVPQWSDPAAALWEEILTRMLRACTSLVYLHVVGAIFTGNVIRSLPVKTLTFLELSSEDPRIEYPIYRTDTEGLEELCTAVLGLRSQSLRDFVMYHDFYWVGASREEDLVNRLRETLGSKHVVFKRIEPMLDPEDYYNEMMKDKGDGDGDDAYDSEDINDWRY